MRWGLELLTGTILTYETEEKALAAQQRMKRFPTTRYTTLLYREVSGWHRADGPWAAMRPDRSK